MSNPLATFRKNRTFWMAGLVLLAILAFVVAPAIDTLTQGYSSGGDAGDKAVVVSWDNGKLTVADVRHATIQHGRLVRFLRALADKVIAAGGQPEVPGAGFSFDPRVGQVFNVGINMYSDEEMICRSRILASYAKSMGVEFTDESADDFMELFCNQRITPDVYEKTLRDSTDGQLTEFEIREILKTEMASNVAFEMGRSGIYTQTPGKTWLDFLKLNQTAKVEAFPVLVEDFVKEITGQPSEMEIQSIFDEGITRAADPRSSEPGFIRRYQANIEYVQANFQDWVEREKANITEEQIRSEYDRRVELKLMDIPVTDGVQSPTTSTEAEVSPPSPETTSPETTPPETTPPETTSLPVGSQPPASDATQLNPSEPAVLPVVETPATETPLPETNEQPATPTTEPATTDPAANDSTSEAPSGEPSSDDQSATERSAKVHLIAFRQGEQTQSEIGLPPPVVQPPPPIAVMDAQAAVPSEASNDAATTPAATGDGVVTPTRGSIMRTRTFEESRDEIAEQLARTAIIPKLDEVLTQVLVDQMTPYYGDFREYRAFVESGVDLQERGELPVRPDLKKFAANNNLQHGETGLVDGMKLALSELGRSEIAGDGSGFSGMVANTLMGPQVELFKPLQSYYFDDAASRMSGKAIGSQFIFWKTAERPAYIPELSEVRDEVIDAWKRIQARELAAKAAQSIAEKLNAAAADPWENAISTTQRALLIETGPFTWMSRMSAQANIDTSVVPNLDDVGPAFMEQVFSKERGEVGVAPNQAKGTFYVFRVLEKAPEISELRDRFNADPMKSGPLNIGRNDGQRTFSEWYQSLDQDMNVEWQVPLSQLQ